jgi:hypothetical protein
MIFRSTFSTILAIALFAAHSPAAPAVSGPPPGVVVTASLDAQKIFVRSPTIAILPDGSYLVGHDYGGQGAGARRGSTFVLSSRDRGATWLKLAELTDQVHPGENALEIRVTNLWTNRLIGDEALPRTDGYRMRDAKMPAWYLNNEPMPAGPRSTFTTYNFYEQNRTLLPSGLLGPVTLSQESHTLVAP